MKRLQGGFPEDIRNSGGGGGGGKDLVLFHFVNTISGFLFLAFYSLNNMKHISFFFFFFFLGGCLIHGRKMFLAYVMTISESHIVKLRLHDLMGL